MHLLILNQLSQLYSRVPSTCDSHVPLTEPPVPVPDSCDGFLCLPENAECSLDPLQCLLQGFGQFGPFGRNLLLLEGGHCPMGVPVESRERGVECLESEIDIANNSLKAMLDNCF